MAKGFLKINVYGESIANPVKQATVIISKDEREILRTTTNSSGETEVLTLDTVSKDYSEEEQYEVRPYETYDITVYAFGLTPTTITGVQIFDGITSMQDVYMSSIDTNKNMVKENITPNSLWENSNMENEETSSNNNQISPVILKEVIIPNTIIVHNGNPSSNAENLTVPFTDYIKNVASSEIYSTWSEETIKANVLAIISFTLNRIYTEWYPSRGYNFNITSTPTYDQKYTKNGTIFEPIAKIVDEIFDEFIRKGIRIEPLLAHYKSNTSEEGYLSQWGSKDLGDKGYSALQILKYYYGNDVNIYDGLINSNNLYSFTKTLKLGDCSDDVYLLQNALNYIHSSYPAIPLISNPNGYYDERTKEAVRVFQKVFSLTQNGEANKETWYKVSYILTAVENLTANLF